MTFFTLERFSRQTPRRPRAERKRRAGRTSRRPELERFEARTLLTGTWTPVATSGILPVALGTMLLQPDGSVMVNGEGAGQSPSNTWYKLTPDATGSYTNGTWSALPSMSVARRFFASDVLPSGKILVIGGEYASDQNESRSGEIYDPVANTWSSIAPFPEAQFGDGITETLADGRVLAGSPFTSHTYIYNSLTNQWTNGPDLPNGDHSAEESWVKLPDNSILSYEIQGTAPQTTHRFVPGATDAQDQWVSAGSVPVALASNGGNAGIVPELGPAFRLASGNVFFLGASGHTAIYTPPTPSNPTGTWVQGPDILNGLGAFDTPGAVEPDGKVVFSAGPINGNTFPGPTTVFEYDPNANSIAQVTAAGPDLSLQPYRSRMLVLPSGQVLFGTSTPNLYAYNPDSPALAAGAPTITGINGSGTYTLTGTQLNGISEGAGYGDDAQMASNYPIIRLVDASNHMDYARTFNWSSTGVATGSATVSTNFTLPSGIADGHYALSVVANGIASGPVAVDVAGGQIVLSKTFAIAADHTLWEYDGPNATQISTGSFLSISAGTDAGGNPVVYGVVQDTVAGSTVNDLWEYDAGTWSRLSTQSFRSIAAAPGGVVYGVVQDAVSGSTVNDLWKFVGTTATRLSTASFLSISAGTDAGGNPVVYGVVQDRVSGEPVDDLWEYNGSALVNLSTGSFHAIAAAPGGVVYGVVQDPSNNSADDLWEYNGSAWSRLSTSSFLSISASTDASGNPVVYGVVQDTVAGSHVDDLWEYNGSALVNLSTGSFLSVSAAPKGAVYGIVQDAVNGSTVNDLWEYSGFWSHPSSSSFFSLSNGADVGGNPAVAPLSASTGAAGSPVAYGIVQDTVSTYRVNDLWGYSGPPGTNLSPGSFLSVSAAPGGVVYGIVQDIVNGLAVDDLWEYNGSAWSRLSTASFLSISAAPGGLVYGIVQDTVGGTPVNDLWEFNGTTATRLSTQSFLSISAGSLAGGTTVVYGVVQDRISGVPVNDIWEYNGTTGTLLASGNTVSISATSGGVVYAIIDTPVGGSTVNALWEYNGSAWTMLSAQSFLSISAGTDASGSPVVYGVVQDTVAGSHVDDLWEYNGSALVNLSTGGFLSVSAAPGGVVYGIVQDTVSGSTVNDLWEYNGTWSRLSTQNFVP